MVLLVVTPILSLIVISFGIVKVITKIINITDGTVSVGKFSLPTTLPTDFEFIFPTEK